ncbi:MAG: hypothetical protein V1736_08315 [Pseudomonadota bacterium]
MQKAPPDDSFAKNALAYSGSNFLGQFLTLIKGFIVRRILPPEIMGFMNLMVALSGLAGTFDLGCISGAGRELAMMHGRAEAEEPKRIRSTTLWFTLVQNVLIGAGIILYVWWKHEHYSLEQSMATCVAAAVLVIGTFQMVYSTFISTAQAFVVLSKMLVLGSIVDGLCLPIFAYVWGLPGVMAATVITACLICGIAVLAGRKMGQSAGRGFSLGTLKRLLSFGFFLRLVDYPNALLHMASLLWVTRFMSIQDLALFSLARSFFSQLTDIGTKVGTVYSMRYLHQNGLGVGKDVVSAQLKQFLFFQLFVAVPLLSWVAGVLAPFVVKLFIPKYSGSNQATIILLICGFFYVLNSGLTNPWILEKKLAARGVASMAGLLFMLSALSIPWFLFGSRTIESVAYSTLTGYFLYFCYMVIAVGKGLWRTQDLIEIILSVTAAAAWTLFILQKGYGSLENTGVFLKDLAGLSLMGGWTILALLPIPAYGLIRSGISRGWYTGIDRV